MNPSASHTAGLSLRQAALIAGIAYILNPVTYAETVYPHLVIHGNIAQTVQNIAARPGTFAVIIFSYLISFIGDIVIAWALYVLLAPVNRALSLLTAFFQLVYAAVALDGVMHLLTVFNLITTPELRATFTDAALQSQDRHTAFVLPLHVQRVAHPLWYSPGPARLPRLSFHVHATVARRLTRY